MRNDSTPKPPDAVTSLSSEQPRHVSSGNKTKNHSAVSASSVSRSRAVTVGLVVSLTVGISLFIVVIALVGKRHYDSWRLSDYTAVRHLIDGMND